MRLRRQKEVEVGKDWINRAKEAEATDENENEADKLMFSRFCQGLERLDNAAIQLDEIVKPSYTLWRRPLPYTLIVLRVEKIPTPLAFTPSTNPTCW